MKKLTKASLSELAKSKEIISFREQKSYVGGGSGSKEDPFTAFEFRELVDHGHWTGGWVTGVSKMGYQVVNTGGTYENFITDNILTIGGSSEIYDGGTDGTMKFYTVKQYNDAIEEGTWGGGFVQNYGYIGMEFTVTEKSRITSLFGGNSCQYYLVEGIGSTAGTNVQGYTVIQNGEIFVSVSNAAYTRPELNQGIPTGVAVLYVDGNEMESQDLALEGSYIYRTGDNPVGNAKFNLTKYSGRVEIKVRIYFHYDSGAGNKNHVHEETVYSANR
nr:hypothetical protein [uncultured Prevotella sp.]